MAIKQIKIYVSFLCKTSDKSYVVILMFQNEHLGNKTHCDICTSKAVKKARKKEQQKEVAPSTADGVEHPPEEQHHHPVHEEGITIIPPPKKKKQKFTMHLFQRQYFFTH